MENWGFFFTTIQLELVSQSTTTMRNRKEVAEDFRNSKHRETTTIPTKTKIKIAIYLFAINFYYVTECFIVLQSFRGKGL